MDPEINITCNNCGGVEFHNDAGYYYCNECQTQSQEICERVYDEHEHTRDVQFEKGKKIPTSRSSTSDVQRKITTFEGYNYILAGLTKELLNVGAKSECKEFIYYLWLLYLLKIEYLNENEKEKPKLGLSYKKRDKEILYKCKPRKRKSKSLSTTSAENYVTGRELQKRRRALAKAEYDAHTSISQSETPSLLNQSLSSLATESNPEEDGQMTFSLFNKFSQKVMRRKMSKNHIMQHIMDVNNTMKCHKKSKCFSQFYLSPFALTRNKLYSILYLSLLLSKSDIQLGDLLRFCREGHISYLSYRHLFPEHLTDNQINIAHFQMGHQALVTHNNIREATFKLLKMLKLPATNLAPDLRSLSRRYCAELNLPDQIKNAVLNLMTITKPKCESSPNKVTLPNYEGRAMAFILYVLKLLFSLDGVTEYKYSKLAHDVNKKDDSLLMFVWDKWVNFMNYRRLILARNHFPSKFYLNENNANNDLFLNFLIQNKAQDDYVENLDLIRDVNKKLLEDLETLQINKCTESIEFKHSLTPNRSYMNTVRQNFNDTVNLNGNKLHDNFLVNYSAYKLDFLFDPQCYLTLLDKKCKFLDVCANSNQHFVKIKDNLVSDIELDNKTCNSKIKNEVLNKEFEKIKTEEIVFEKLVNKMIELKEKNISPEKNNTIINNSSNPVILKTPKVGRNAKGQFCSWKSKDAKDHSQFKPIKRRPWFVSSWTSNPNLQKQHYNPSLSYQILRKKSIETFLAEEIDVIIKKRTRLISKNSDVHPKRQRKLSESGNNLIFHQPHLDYWVYVTDVAMMNRREWKEFELSLPSSFQWLLNECARVIEQNTKELFLEFVIVELYVNYVYLKNCPLESNSDDNFLELNKLIKKIKNYW